MTTFNRRRLGRFQCLRIVSKRSEDLAAMSSAIKKVKKGQKGQKPGDLEQKPDTKRDTKNPKTQKPYTLSWPDFFLCFFDLCSLCC